jgi:pimeloyl-ACP methyl ester carboxylesterase
VTTRASFATNVWRQSRSNRIFTSRCGQPAGLRVRGEFLDLGGARLYYYAAGTRGAGVPVVFIHGFPTSSHLWGDVVPLMPPGHRLVIVDLLGYGRSDRPLGHSVDIDAHTQRAVALLDELRIQRACIVGHGFGAGIAQVLTINHPKRVSSLCLIDSVAPGRPPLELSRSGLAVLAMARALPASVILATLHRELRRGYIDGARAEHSIDLYLRPFHDAAGRTAMLAHLRSLARMQNPSSGPNLSTISVPTSLIWGERDRLVPWLLGRRLQSKIPAATLGVIPGARHFTPEESPQRVAELIATLLER